jgi:hypothetical protein
MKLKICQTVQWAPITCFIFFFFPPAIRFSSSGSNSNLTPIFLTPFHFISFYFLLAPSSLSSASLCHFPPHQRNPACRFQALGQLAQAVPAALDRRGRDRAPPGIPRLYDVAELHAPHRHRLFYDRIKSKLQLDFKKNQLVEKLRRLKIKYRNVLGKITAGNVPHDLEQRRERNRPPRRRRRRSQPQIS